MKKLAALLDRDKLALEKIGVPAAANVGKVLALRVRFAREESPAAVAPVIHEYMSHMQPIILDGMVAAHLSARARAIRMAARAKAHRKYHMSAYDEALAYYKKRLDLSSEDIQKLRTLYGNEAAKVTRSASDLVEKKAAQAIKESIEAGEHIAAAQARLQAAMTAAGISEPSPFLCETLVRTGIAQAYNAGQWNALQDDSLDGLLQGYEYVTVGDNRVSDICQEFDGFEGPTDNEFWQTHWPPNHFNCRCSCLPVFSGLEDNIPDDYGDPEEGFGFNPGIIFKE